MSIYASALDRVAEILSRPPAQRMETETKEVASWLQRKVKAFECVPVGVLMKLVEECGSEWRCANELIIREGDIGTCQLARWLGREFTDQKVRGSNPASDCRLPLSRLGQPGSIPALEKYWTQVSFLLELTVAHIQWPCRDLNPGNLTYEASVMYILLSGSASVYQLGDLEEDVDDRLGGATSAAETSEKGDASAPVITIGQRGSIVKDTTVLGRCVGLLRRRRPRGFCQLMFYLKPNCTKLANIQQLNVLHQVASCFSRYDIRDIAIQSGAIFGEVALIEECRRIASIVANPISRDQDAKLSTEIPKERKKDDKEKTDQVSPSAQELAVQLVVIPRALYDKTVRSILEAQFRMRTDFVNQVPYFRRLNSRLKEQIILSLEIQTFEYGCEIFRAGSEYRGFYYIF
ncbi:hypothetical protein T265_14809, partial [Opisthorchis viverrini]